MRSTKKNKRRLRRRVLQRGGDRVIQPTDKATAASGVGSIYAVGQTGILAEEPPTTTAEPTTTAAPTTTMSLAAQNAIAAGMDAATMTFNMNITLIFMFMLKLDDFSKIPLPSTSVEFMTLVDAAASIIINNTIQINSPPDDIVFILFSQLITDATANSTLPYLAKLMNSASNGNINSNVIMGYINKMVSLLVTRRPDFQTRLTTAASTPLPTYGGGKKTHKKRRTRGGSHNITEDAMLRKKANAAVKHAAELRKEAKAAAAEAEKAAAEAEKAAAEAEKAAAEAEKVAAEAEKALRYAHAHLSHAPAAGGRRSFF